MTLLAKISGHFICLKRNGFMSTWLGDMGVVYPWFPTHPYSVLLNHQLTFGPAKSQMFNQMIAKLHSVISKR